MKPYLLLLVFLASTISVFSQSKTVYRCDFRADIYPFSAINDDLPIMLSEVNALLKNTKRKKTIKPEDKATYLFTNLPEGDYELTATAPKYQKTIQSFSLNCPQSIPFEPISQIFFLWAEGEIKPKETSLMTRGVFGIANHGSGALTSGVKSSANDSQLVNGKAWRLISPPYPSAARAVRASGAVNVQVTINELGYVISATAIDGHPLLRSAAEKAARESRFKTTMLSGIPVKVTGIVVYNFIAQ